MFRCKIRKLWHRLTELDLGCSFDSQKQTAPECEPPKAYQIDGLADSLKSVMPSRRVREEGDIPAIFVHAGAGYHSVQNEHIHLEACAG